LWFAWLADRVILFHSPFIIAFIGQFVCVGFISPVWFYLHYVFNTPNEFSSPASRTISPTDAVAVLPAVTVAYLIPHFLCYFHPDFDARHWWNWIWQIYPVWGAVVFAVASTALAPFAASLSSRSIVRATLGVLAVIGTGSYWYALSAAEFSVAELLVPRFFTEAPGEAAVALRTIIQYDYACCFLAAMLWVGYGIGDLKTAKAIDVSWAAVLAVAAVSWVVLGTGTTLILGWTWRNEVLESGALDKATGKKKIG
jgi:hypothetical protein